MIAMVFDLGLSLGGFIGGLAVGFTGMGGGAILTPMLVLIFNVPAGAAIGTDLVASLVMKPVSGFIHLKRGTVRLDIVKWLCFGSVPGAAMGAIFVGRLSDEVKENFLLRGLGVVLLLAAGAMSWRAIKISDGRDRFPSSSFAHLDPRIIWWFYCFSYVGWFRILDDCCADCFIPCFKADTVGGYRFGSGNSSSCHCSDRPLDCR